MSTDYTEFESKMKKTASVLTEQYDSVRAGKANPAVLDRITVDYYGSPTPIQQIASVSTPDARSLLIQPWDASVLKGIEKAILASDLGLNPQNDGRTIRLIFPALTEERRRDLVKQVKKCGLKVLEVRAKFFICQCTGSVPQCRLHETAFQQSVHGLLKFGCCY